MSGANSRKFNSGGWVRSLEGVFQKRFSWNRVMKTKNIPKQPAATFCWKKLGNPKPEIVINPCESSERFWVGIWVDGKALLGTAQSEYCRNHGYHGSSTEHPGSVINYNS